MASFTQIFIQIVFSTKQHDYLIPDEIKGKVFAYISGIINHMGHKSLAVNGTNDHVHIFISYNPKYLLKDLIHEVKRCSNLYIQENRSDNMGFYWQEGYGAFSYSRSDLDKVINYIKNQEEHHKRKTFAEEYAEFIEKYKLLGYDQL